MACQPNLTPTKSLDSLTKKLGTTEILSQSSFTSVKGSSGGVVANVQNCDIVVNAFELQLNY